MSLALYFLASAGTVSSRPAVQSVELMIGWALLAIWHAASMALFLSLPMKHQPCYVIWYTVLFPVTGHVRGKFILNYCH